MQAPCTADDIGDCLFSISAESVGRIEDALRSPTTSARLSEDSSRGCGQSARGFASCFSERQTVGCYSWIARDDEHTVASPGLPPVVSRAASVTQGQALKGRVIKKSSKLEFCDENAYHDPQHPVEQLVCSVDACQRRWATQGRVSAPCACVRVLREQQKAWADGPVPSVHRRCSLKRDEPSLGDGRTQATATATPRDETAVETGLCLGQFDFITDRTNLRVLLRFLYPGVTRYSREASVDLDVYGNVCVLTRISAETRAPDVGYGHSFEHCCCETQTVSLGEKGAVKDDTYEIVDLSSFHLVQAFTLCDAVRVLVRSEVDACCHPAARAAPDCPEKFQENRFFGRCGARVANPEYTPMAQQGPTLYLSRQEPANLTPFETALLAREEWLLMELKSVSERYVSNIPWLDIYFQMRLGDIHRLLVASHTQGKIGRVELLTLTSVAEKAFRQTPHRRNVTNRAPIQGDRRSPWTSDDSRNTACSRVEPECAAEVVYWSRLTSLLLQLKQLALNQRGDDGKAFLRIQVTEEPTFHVYRRKQGRPRVSADIGSAIMKCSLAQRVYDSKPSGYTSSQ
ncbi:putative transcription factor btf3 [Neospora caninum Liverpool]|uniref:Putative transcription factor btf3 n=1 Tax=Neospora caninum (strain Liverpool) TaxID=572307 RepID=F0VHK3_NEOCL|nr:putative transcription factor btf3 [Neospora caninum Liverpool]CBZ53197.1 putative transcription factor btf3 [Neospora caninum Liverpool]CEL67187.1 TPA: transcription factor btf3, putative [Neospora caninum Liverpool]|eukprot:XP_003883229.1 putative transcription factor btf3 [Neospora caninum Liverpool]